MKIKDGFILKDVAGSKIVIATGDAKMSFNGVITFNSVGAEIFDLLDGTNTPEADPVRQDQAGGCGTAAGRAGFRQGQ